jgi:hypothetical protein
MENKEDFKFFNFDVERVQNGFILTFDRRTCSSPMWNNIYVFNTLKDLSKFISEL